MLLNCGVGVGEDSWRVPWTARRSNQSILKEINPEYWLEGLILKLKLQYFGTWCEELNHWERPWCWERLKAGGEGDDRGWDSWIASPTRWTWVWASSGSWWWTGKPGVLQLDTTEQLNWLEVKKEPRSSVGIWEVCLYLPANLPPPPPSPENPSASCSVPHPAFCSTCHSILQPFPELWSTLSHCGPLTEVGITPLGQVVYSCVLTSIPIEHMRFFTEGISVPWWH